MTTIRGNFEWTDESKTQAKFVPNETGTTSLDTTPFDYEKYEKTMAEGMRHHEMTPEERYMATKGMFNANRSTEPPNYVPLKSTPWNTFKNWVKSMF